MDRLFFEKSWLQFLCKFLESVDPPINRVYPEILPEDSSEVEWVAFIRQAFLEIFCRANNIKLVRRVSIVLKRFFHSDVLSARWYLHEIDRTRIELYLRECTFAEARVAVAATIVHGFRALIDYEENALAEVDAPDSESDTESIVEEQLIDEAAREAYEQHLAQRALRLRSQASTWRFLRQFYRTIDGSPWSWRQWHEYFLVLREVCILSENTRRFLLLKNRDGGGALMNRLIELYHGQNIFGQKKFLRTKIGDRYTQPNHHSIVSLIFVLAAGCNTGAKDSENSPYALEGDKFRLSLSAPLQEHLFNPKFIIPVLRNRTAPDDVARVIVHWSFNADKRSERILDLMHKGIEDSLYTQLRGFMEALWVLLTFDQDALQQRRIGKSVEFLIRLAIQRYQHADHVRSVKTIFEYLLAYKKDSPAFARHLDSVLTAEHIAWITNFMKQNAKLQSGFFELPLAPGFWRMLPTADIQPDEAQLWIFP